MVGLAVDQQAALFAEACLAAGEAKCTYGTGAFLLATTGSEPRRSRNGLVGVHRLAAPRRRRRSTVTTYCLDGQVYTVGAAVHWLTEVGVVNEPADLDRLGGQADGAGGATFVPGLAGLAAPFWEPNARGAFTGLSLATTRAELVRAVIEGIAAQVAWLARAVRDDLGRAAGAAPGGRRADPVPRPHADAGRPAPGAGRGVRVAARDRARRRRVRTPGARGGRDRGRGRRRLGARRRLRAAMRAGTRPTPGSTTGDAPPRRRSPLAR